MARTVVRGVVDVLEAVNKRISFLFDNYENIQLAFSGGKDSTVLFHLINAEAIKRDRKFILYFQDQEAEYQGTIDFVAWAIGNFLCLGMSLVTISLMISVNLILEI